MFSCLLQLSWRRLSILSLVSARGQLLPCLANSGNTWSQVQKQCSRGNIGARAVGRTSCWSSECYFVTLPIAYYQGQHIVTPEGKSYVLGRGTDLHCACKCTSPAALGDAGRDVPVSSCSQVTLEGMCLCPAVPRWLWKGCAHVQLCPGYSGRRQLCPAHPAPHCHLGCTHPLWRNM